MRGRVGLAGITADAIEQKPDRDLPSSGHSRLVGSDRGSSLGISIDPGGELRARWCSCVEAAELPLSFIVPKRSSPRLLTQPPQFDLDQFDGLRHVVAPFRCER
jgi:hypothetical protein